MPSSPDAVHPHARPPARAFLVEMKGVNKAYGGVGVLRRAELAIEAGEIHGLVGENGAGKSTLVKILAGEVARDGGEIYWQGRPTTVTARVDAQRLGITMIHQELNLAPHLTVAQNLFLGHEPVRRGVLDHRLEVSEAQSSLERLGFDLDARTTVRRLSLAQRQLVEIARAVVQDQRLVIMDEPTSSLSAKEVEELFAVIRQLKAKGTAVVFVTHRLEELAEISDRVTVLRDGETVHCGPMPRREFSGLIRAMVGRELRDFYPARMTSPGEIALEVRTLGRGSDFDEISFVLRRGEVVGLSGLVGAGRTELAEAIFGVAPANRGEILVEGKPVVIRSPEDALGHGIALITEDRKRTGLAASLSITHNVTLANLRALVRHGVLSLEKERQVAGSHVERLCIRAASTTQKVARLSGGNQQKVVLAKWLFRQARIFLFDEPTRGVDVGAKSEIYRLMNELAESGAAILMISSELPEILGMTDRVLVMRSGRLVRELATRTTNPEAIMRWAALGE